MNNEIKNNNFPTVYDTWNEELVELDQSKLSKECDYRVWRQVGDNLNLISHFEEKCLSKYNPCHRIIGNTKKVTRPVVANPWSRMKSSVGLKPRNSLGTDFDSMAFASALEKWQSNPTEEKTDAAFIATFGDIIFEK